MAASLLKLFTIRLAIDCAANAIFSGSTVATSVVSLSELFCISEMQLYTNNEGLIC